MASLLVRSFVATLAFALVDARAVTLAPSVGEHQFRSLVTAVYKEYAWVAVFADAPRASTFVLLADAPLPVLKKIFSPDLAAAIYRDVQCTRASHELCLLEAELLFDSQDPDVRELVVREKSPALAEVCFKEQQLPRCFEISGVRNRRGAWRIADIRYDRETKTLRQMLKLAKNVAEPKTGMENLDEN